MDFESRPWIPHSGWPISKRDLDPYYERANQACGLGPCRYDFSSWESALARAGRQAPRFDPSRLQDSIFHVIADERLRFGETFGPELRAASNLDVYLYATAMELETDDSAGAVRAMRFAGRTASGFASRRKSSFWPRRARDPADSCCSRIARGRAGSATITISSDGFSRSIRIFARALRSSDARTARSRRVPSGSGPRSWSSASPRRRSSSGSKRLPNFEIRLLPIVGEWLATVRAAASAGSTGSCPRDWRQVAFSVSRKFLRFPSGQVQYDLKYRTFGVHFSWEQIPDPDSRLRLSSERDALGQPRLELDWRLNSQDRDALLWRPSAS